MADEASAPSLPGEAWVVGLASLPDVGPARLAALLAAGPPQTVWAELLDGRLPPSLRAVPLGADPSRLGRSWTAAAAQIDVADLWQRHRAVGVGVSVHGGLGYPAAFVDDPEPPMILFHLGDPDVVAGPRVAIVGTRDCTRYGYDLAFEFGRDLAAAGVRVVSGLALGIDGAAHAGALEAGAAPPIAVVGTGLDVVYPRRNGPLWRAVARAGVIFTEYPLGTPAAAWHFPARNRLIAALADIVVVVESHREGGSMLTVDEAVQRGREVLAVPGPVRSEASQGTNALLFDGHGVVRTVDDILEGLGLMRSSAMRADDRRPSPDDDDLLLLDAIGWQPTSVEDLVSTSGRSLGEVGLALDRLEEQGWIASRGSWFERVARADG